MTSIEKLELFAMLGFNGNAPNGLQCHPDGIHVIYSSGNKICIQNWINKKMDFLCGHTNTVSCVQLSSKGNFIGSGQKNRVGFKALVILWDFNCKTKLTQHELHKATVEAIFFSSDESLLISIGGKDCGQIVIWDNVDGKAKFTLQASKPTTGNASTLITLNQDPYSFISAGDGTLRLWTLNLESKFSSVVDISMGKLKRCIICITINKEDTLAYCGTTSGDILKIKMFTNYDDGYKAIKPVMQGCFAKCGKWEKGRPRPENICYIAGTKCISVLENEELIVGGGDGTVDLLSEIIRKKPLPKTKLFCPVSPDFKCINTIKLNNAISSIQVAEKFKEKNIKKLFLVGTSANEIYGIDIFSFQAKLLLTCHVSAINDLKFPWNMSDVFATAGYNDIRIWSLKSCQELLRIQVSNFVCNSIQFTNDGKSIVSGWDDGCIRAFTPITGKLIYCIYNAHNKGVSAIAVNKNGNLLISGGCEGQVRIWSIQGEKQTLTATLKEHKCPISDIIINNTDFEAVSAGTDGTCIIWDIVNFCRRQILFASTVFMSVCYEPTGCQILTVGTDRRVAYWEAGNGNLVREVEASKSKAINSIHINSKGNLFVTGGHDQKVKLWLYQEGIYTHVGADHSGIVTKACFTPDSKYIVSTTSTGSIFIWKCPQEYLSNGVKHIDTKRSSALDSCKREENISRMNTSRSSILSVCSSKSGK